MMSLKPTYFIDSDNAAILSYAKNITKDVQNNTAKTIALFKAVRDNYYYDPYQLNLNKEGLVASSILKRKSAYCVEKAILLCALLRALKIPARLNFGNVRNHIAVDKLVDLLETDLLVFHGCTEVLLDNSWYKITPAFNKSLCEKLKVPVLEFNGTSNAIFQQYGNEGQRFMEYVHEYGSFDDMPYTLFINELKKHYTHIQFPENLHLNLNT